MARSSALSGQQPSAEALYSPINPRLDVEDDRQGYRGEKINLNTGAHETSSRTDLYRISEWKWELFAWIIGTAIIASMVYILTRFHDKPLEEWPISIQISSAVAFLAQVAQAALLSPTEACIGQLKWSWFEKTRKAIHMQKFDEASRGPLGSLILLFTLSTAPRLVHLGALITIFMLVFSTFLQQAVQIQLQPLQYTAQPATVPRSKQYFWPPAPDAWSTGFIYGNTITRSNTNLTNTVISSIIGDERSLSDINAICPSEQCTWEPYTTLALCYSTEDISSQLIEQPEQTGRSELAKDYTLPGIIVSQGTEFLTAWLTTVFGNGNETIDYIGQQANVTIPELKLTNSDSNLDDLAHIYLTYQDPCLMKGQDDLSIDSWRALKGTLRLCLQTLKTTRNTSTDTTVIESFTNLTWEQSINNTLDQTSNNAFREYGVWSTSLGDAADKFAIDVQTTELIAGQIATSFNFSASFRPGGDNYLYGSMFASNFVSEVLGPEPLVCPNSTEYGIHGFDKRIANVAIGMTNTFRAADSSVLVPGTSFRTVQFIHVRFWSLAPPGALFAAITVFFFATVLSTAKVPVWKSSQLAVLYAMHEPRKLDTKGTMEEQAEQMNLGFSARGDWQLEHD